MMSTYDPDRYSEEELDTRESKWGSIPPIKSKNKDRAFDDARQCLVRDFFSGTSSAQNEADFERRLRAPRDFLA